MINLNAYADTINDGVSILVLFYTNFFPLSLAFCQLSASAKKQRHDQIGEKDL